MSETRKCSALGNYRRSDRRATRGPPTAVAVNHLFYNKPNYWRTRTPIIQVVCNTSADQYHYTDICISLNMLEPNNKAITDRPRDSTQCRRRRRRRHRIVNGVCAKRRTKSAAKTTTNAHSKRCECGIEQLCALLSPSFHLLARRKGTYQRTYVYVRIDCSSVLDRRLVFDRRYRCDLANVPKHDV